ncbi:hypothetical protein EVA_14660 [gut metagenome]|uniref:Uncharacterized protein n=1 Tax=gut metagenome TaxID=749906 RepID=J9FRW0_9ZZZZ
MPKRWISASGPKLRAQSVPRSARIVVVTVTAKGRVHCHSSTKYCTDISRMEMLDVSAATKRQT